MKIGEGTFDPDYFMYDLVQLQEQLFYYALQLTEDREDALDLVQEYLYQLLEKQSLPTAYA